MIGITEFINGCKMARDKQKYIEPHITLKYLPFEQKDAQANVIVKLAMNKKVNDKNVFWINTPVRYQLFTQAVIKLYTDIDLTDGKKEDGAILAGFNKLEDSNLMTDIITAIGPDFERFKTVFQMVTDDYIQNNVSMINYLDTKVDAFSMVLNTMEDALNQVITNNAIDET